MITAHEALNKTIEALKAKREKENFDSFLPGIESKIIEAAEKGNNSVEITLISTGFFHVSSLENYLTHILPLAPHISHILGYTIESAYDNKTFTISW